MNIAREINGLVTHQQAHSTLALKEYGDADKTTDYAAQTVFRQFSKYFTLQSQLQRQLTYFSPLFFLVSSLQAMQGIGKTAFIALLVFSQVDASSASDPILTLNAPTSYTVIPGSNASLANPPISVFVTWPPLSSLNGRSVGCTLTLSLPLTGRLFLSSFSAGKGFYTDSLDPKILDMGADDINSLNAGLQHLMFEAKLVDISSTLTVDCVADYSNVVRSIRQTPLPNEKTAVITLTGKYQPPAVTIPTTTSVITSQNTPSQPSVSTSSTTVASQRPTSSSGPMLTSLFPQSPAIIQSSTPSSLASPSNTQTLFSMRSITPALSPSDNAVQISKLSEASNSIPSTLSVNTTYPLLNMSDPANFSSGFLSENNVGSSDKSINLMDNGTLQWILVAVAGVALLCSMFGLAGYVVHRKKNKVKSRVSKIDNTNNERKSSVVNAAQGSTLSIQPRAPYSQQDPQFLGAHSAREQQGIGVSQHYLNAPANFESFRSTQQFHSAVFDNHHYVNVTYANHPPQGYVQAANGTGHVFNPSSHYDSPLERIRELELNPPQAQYVGINDV